MTRVTPFFGSKLHLVLNHYIRILFSVDHERFVPLSTAFSLFLYLLFCLLINARWYIHFGFHMITSYLVSVPLLKGRRGLVHNCSNRQMPVC